MTGSPLLPGVTATVNGQARPLTVLDATHVRVTLAASDLWFAGVRSLRLVNPLPGDTVSQPLTFTVHNAAKRARTYVAFGDSNTSGYGPAAPAGVAYPALVAAANHLDLQPNVAGVSVQACDIYPAQIYPYVAYWPAADRVYTLMAGENDIFQWGAGDHKQVFDLCHRAAIAWLALPSDLKLWGGNPAGLSWSNSCSSDLDRFGTYYCTGAGAVSADAYATYGHPLYVWYLLDPKEPVSATFTLQVDGQDVAVGKTAVGPGLPTTIGVARSIGVLRVPLLAGSHKIVAKTDTGGIGILGFGTAPASLDGLPVVIVGDVLNTLAGANNLDPLVHEAYNAGIRGNIAALKADGLDVRYVETGAFISGAPEEMSDPIHLSILGHKHLADAFQTGFADLLP